jgi:dipeptidyl aminopeptidase/acylaminoacyl peptidase
MMLAKAPTNSALLLLGVLMTIEVKSPATAQSAPTLDEVLSVTTIADVAVAPDGAEVAYVVRERDRKGQATSVIHVVSTADGRDRVLAKGNAPAWSPDGKSVAFISDKSGSRQVWLVAASGDGAEMLTRHEDYIDRFRWAPDSQSIAFLSRQKHASNLKHLTTAKSPDDPIVVDQNNLPMNRLFVIDTESQMERAVTRDDYSVGGYEQWFPDTFSWSPDSQQIAFSKRPHAKAGGHLLGDVAIVPADGGPSRLIVQREGMDGYPLWSPDGRPIAFISTERNDWVTVSFLYTVEVETGAVRNITPDFDEKIKQFFWADDGRQILYIAGDRVGSQIYSVDVAAGEVRPLTEGTDYYSDLCVSQDGKCVAFVRENSHEPPEVHFTTLAEFRPKRLTRVDARRDNWPKIETDIMRWQSFDGMEIEGLVHKPLGYKPGQRYPLLVVPHGGPHGVMSNTFVGGEYRLFAQRGWVVFRPNFRGSGHYGEKFLRANLRSWGIGDFEDVMSGVDHLISRGLVDSNRMGISGSSYGGYMTSWTISQTNRFRAAVVGAAITDVPSFVRTTDVPQRFESYLGQDAKRYYRSSPMHFADNITTPTLIWHGDADIRVPVMQGRHLYTALQKNNVPVEFVIYPGEPHGIARASNQRDLLERKLNWLTKWVLEDDSR